MFLEVRVNDYKLTSCGNGLSRVVTRIEEPLGRQILRSEINDGPKSVEMGAKGCGLIVEEKMNILSSLPRRIGLVVLQCDLETAQSETLQTAS